MSLVFSLLVTWTVIFILSLIPKKLSEVDMVILYFLNTIFELSIFSIININLKWVTVNHSLETSLSDLLFRLVMIPIVFIISSNILLYSWKYLKWIINIGIILCFLILQRIIVSLEIIQIHHLNVWYSIFIFCSYAIFSGVLAWILHVDKKDVIWNDRL